MATFQAVGAVAEAITTLFQHAWEPALAGRAGAGVRGLPRQELRRTDGHRHLRLRLPGHRRPGAAHAASARQGPPAPAAAADVAAADGLGEGRLDRARPPGLGHANDRRQPDPLGRLPQRDHAGVFRPDETVELAPTELTNDEVFQLWQVLPSSLQLSAAYVARLLCLESELLVPTGAPVVERDLDLAALS